MFVLMKIHYVSMRHPESNGLVERANEIIITGIMKSIFNLSKGKWPDELVKVVWNHNTIVSRSTGFTPFKLLFWDEAITPEDASTGSIRTLALVEDEYNCKITKDTIEGVRLQAIDHINKYQAETVKWRDRKVRLKNFKLEHLVLRRITNPDTVGKLQLKWEGPFLVVSSSRPRSYRWKEVSNIPQLVTARRREIFGPNMVSEAEKVKMIRKNLEAAEARQKSYHDKRRKPLQFEVGDSIYLKVSPTKGVQRFGIKGKLAPHYIGPYEIIEACGPVAYKLKLPPKMSTIHNVFHVSELKKCVRLPTELITEPDVEIEPDLSYQEHPSKGLDSKERSTHARTIKMYKIQWSNHSEEEAT
jgi:hypothetical protein